MRTYHKLFGGSFSSLFKADKASEIIGMVIITNVLDLFDNSLSYGSFIARNSVNEAKFLQKLFHGHSPFAINSAMSLPVCSTSEMSITSAGVCIFLSGIETVHAFAPFLPPTE